MTREEAIYCLDHKDIVNPVEFWTAVGIAIEALKRIKAIEGIIDVSNTIIQEDVLKYKMIVDVVKGDWCEEEEK